MWKCADDKSKQPSLTLFYFLFFFKEKEKISPFTLEVIKLSSFVMSQVRFFFFSFLFLFF